MAENILENIERDPLGNRQELGHVILSLEETLREKYEKLKTGPGLSDKKELRDLKLKLDKVDSLKRKLVALGKKIASTEDLPEKDRLALNKAVTSIVKELKIVLKSNEDISDLRAQMDKRTGLIKPIQVNESRHEFSSMSASALSKASETIDQNEEAYGNFTKIVRALPCDFSNEAVRNYFFVYLKNGQKPPLEDIEKSFRDIKTEINTLKTDQKRIFDLQEAIARKQYRRGNDVPSAIDLLKSFSTQVDRQLSFDVSSILAEILNNPTKKVKSYTTWLRANTSAQKREVNKLERTLVLIKKHEQIVDQVATLNDLAGGKDQEAFQAQQLSVVALQIAYFKTLVASLNEEKKNLDKTFYDVESVTSDPKELAELRIQKIRSFEALDTQIKSAESQIKDLLFASETAEDEKNYRAELMDPSKKLSEKSLKFAGNKAKFLARQIEQCKDSMNKNMAESDKASKEYKISRKEPIGEYAFETYKNASVIKFEITYLEFEKSALEGNFNLENALKVYKGLNNNKLTEDLAERCAGLIELYGARELEGRNDNISDISHLSGAFSLFFNDKVQNQIQSGKMDEKVLNGWRGVAGSLLSDYDKLDFGNLQEEVRHVQSMMATMEVEGLKQSFVYQNLERLKKYYQALQNAFSPETESGRAIHGFLEFVVKDAKDNSFDWNTFLKRDAVIIGAAVAGAVMLATPVGIALAATGAPTLATFAFSTAASGIGMTLGQNLAKPYVGVKAEWSNFHTDFLTNWGMSVAFMGAGKAIGYGLGIGATAGNLSWFGRGIIRASTFSPHLIKIKTGTGGLRQALQFATVRPAVEFTQEIAEETLGRVDPRIGAILEIFDSMDGINVKVETHAAVSNLASVAGVTAVDVGDTRATFEYDVGSKSALLGRLASLDSAVDPSLRGTTSVSQSDGSITYTFKQNGKDVAFKFLPSSESFASRAFFSSDIGVALESNFEITQSADGRYEYSGKQQGLANGLKNAGFVTSTTKEGLIVAQKGNLTLELKTRPLATFRAGGVIEFTHKNKRVRGYISKAGNGKVEVILTQNALFDRASDPDVRAYLNKTKLQPTLPQTSLFGDVVTFSQEEFSGMTSGPKKSQRMAVLKESDSGRLQSLQKRSSFLHLGILGPNGLAARAKTQLAEVKAWATTGKASPLTLDEGALAKFDAKFAEEVRADLNHRGLPTNVMEELSLSQQMRVLEDVKMMEDAGHVTPEDFIEVLNSPDGLGVYKAGVILGSLDPLSLQIFAGAMTLDGLASVAEVDQELGKFLLMQKLEAEPDLSTKFLNDITAKFVEKFGNKAEAKLKELAKRISNNDESAVSEFEAIVGSTTLNSILVPILLWGGGGSVVLGGITLTVIAYRAGYFNGRRGKLKEIYKAFNDFETKRNTATTTEEKLDRFILSNKLSYIAVDIESFFLDGLVPKFRRLDAIKIGTLKKLKIKFDKVMKTASYADAELTKLDAVVTTAEGALTTAKDNANTAQTTYDARPTKKNQGALTVANTNVISKETDLQKAKDAVTKHIKDTQETINTLITDADELVGTLIPEDKRRESRGGSSNPDSRIPGLLSRALNSKFGLMMSGIAAATAAVALIIAMSDDDKNQPDDPIKKVMTKSAETSQGHEDGLANIKINSRNTRGAPDGVPINSKREVAQSFKVDETILGKDVDIHASATLDQLKKQKNKMGYNEKYSPETRNRMEVLEKELIDLLAVSQTTESIESIETKTAELKNLLIKKK